MVIECDDKGCGCKSRRIIIAQGNCRASMLDGRDSILLMQASARPTSVKAKAQITHEQRHSWGRVLELPRGAESLSLNPSAFGRTQKEAIVTPNRRRRDFRVADA